MNGFTDIHTHFVYGVDDGAKDAQVMRAMLDEAHRQGVSRIIATSHAELGMRPFDHETYQAHLEEGQEPYTPKAGDAIFIDWDGEAWDGGTEEDHVGVVVKVEDGVVYTLEGNADDHVQAREYPIDDPRITGYIDVRAQS